jgi:hypothetical protein
MVPFDNNVASKGNSVCPGWVGVGPAEAGRLRQHRAGSGYVANEYAQQSDLPRGRFGTRAKALAALVRIRSAIWKSDDLATS